MGESALTARLYPSIIVKSPKGRGIMETISVILHHFHHPSVEAIPRKTWGLVYQL